MDPCARSGPLTEHSFRPDRQVARVVTVDDVVAKLHFGDTQVDRQSSLDVSIGRQVADVDEAEDEAEEDFLLLASGQSVDQRQVMKSM